MVLHIQNLHHGELEISPCHARRGVSKRSPVCQEERAEPQRKPMSRKINMSDQCVINRKMSYFTFLSGPLSLGGGRGVRSHGGPQLPGALLGARGAFRRRSRDPPWVLTPAAPALKDDGGQLFRNAPRPSQPWPLCSRPSAGLPSRGAAVVTLCANE